MNWIAHLDTMATILVSADVASFCVSALFFSERLRQWTYRKRWGSLPSAISHIDSVAMAGMDDLSVGSMRPLPVTILRNPFEARSPRKTGRRHGSDGVSGRVPAPDFQAKHHPAAANSSVRKSSGAALLWQHPNGTTKRGSLSYQSKVKR